MTNPDIVIGLDPGGTTGIAWWSAVRNVYNAEQIQHCDTDSQLLSLMTHIGIQTREHGPLRTHIVCEKFEFRLDERDRTKIDYTAAEVIGALRYWRANYLPDVTLVMQGATKGKGFWTDDKLKKLGVWVPGKKHAMDALRHVLAYRVFDLGHKELLEPFRPSQYPFE